MAEPLTKHKAEELSHRFSDTMSFIHYFTDNLQLYVP